MLRAVYGLSRQQALDLPHWEFHQLIVAFHQQQAKDTLSLYEAVGLAFGGKKEDVRAYVRNLRTVIKGKSDKEKTPTEDTEKTSTDKLADFTNTFAGLLGAIPSVKDYRESLKN